MKTYTLGARRYFAHVPRRRFKIEAARSAGCSAIHFGPTYDWWPSPYPWQGLTRPDGTPRPVCDVIRGAQ